MDVNIYMPRPGKEKSDMIAHTDVMRYDIDGKGEELDLVLKSGDKKKICLKAVDKVVVIKSCCIYTKKAGNLISEKKDGSYQRRERSNHH